MKIAVVVPCHRERRSILAVLEAIGPEVDRVYVVDDGCPEGTGDYVEKECPQERVRVIRHERQRGVGAATVTGYRSAIEDGAEIVVKLDGDGQMDPAMISHLTAPIAAGEADYSKGNRFFRLQDVQRMPAIRMIGNAALSFLTKFSTGYWDLFDPTNGFTAIDARTAREIPLDKLNEGYFFESDLLFRLGTLRAAVVDVPMTARYSNEKSGLRPAREAVPFLVRHLVNFGKRVFYNYFLRNFNIASIELVLGALLLPFGVAVGVYHWVQGALVGTIATSGTVMLAALPVIVGVQLLIGFLSYDMQNVPRTPLQRRLWGRSHGAIS
jgi:glycosyltransferase involved in cell wall biosynthesis